MFEGNEFYIFVYKTYRDVRLVGAPPSAIGKFGGDTDNWMWPAIPATSTCSACTPVPMASPPIPMRPISPSKPKWHFPVSLNGVKEGDFAMVMGYPGSTDRFLSSQGVKLALDIKKEQPSRVKVAPRKLEIYKQHMDASNEMRIKYAAKDAQVSNYWKYFIGSNAA